MRFEEALKHLREGKKVRRPCWDEPTECVSFNDPGEDFITMGNLKAEDWELYEETAWRHECHKGGLGGHIRCWEDRGTLYATTRGGKSPAEVLFCPVCGYSPENKSNIDLGQDSLNQFVKNQDETKTMNFAEAMKLLMQGKTVKRAVWDMVSWSKNTMDMNSVSQNSIEVYEIEATDWIEVVE